jgi:antitoxin HigA-1
MPMKKPPHPGLSVRHDCLEPLGLSVTEAAPRLGVSRKQRSDIVNAARASRGDGDPTRRSVGAPTPGCASRRLATSPRAMAHTDRIKVERLTLAA